MVNADDLIMVYTTFAQKDEALRVSRYLVKEKIAGCVNILSEITSVYEWEGKLEETSEIAVLIKTVKSKQDLLIEELNSQHSYDTPAILVMDITAGHTGYLEWIKQQTVVSCQ